MTGVLKARENDTKNLARWMSGDDSAHVGSIYRDRWLVSYLDVSKNMWDTSPRSFIFSEWGNAAGFPDPEQHNPKDFSHG